MARPIRLLVTGFGPFPRMRDNPSGALALRLAHSPNLKRSGIVVTACILETRYGVVDTLADLIRDTKPDAILMLGVASRARTLRVEERGVRHARATAPDAGGAVPTASIASPEGLRPAIVRTLLPVGPTVATLRSARLPVRRSNDAGRYICNATYYETLRLTGSTIPVLFVHIPRPRPAAGSHPRHRGGERRPSLAAMERGLIDVAKLVAKLAR